MLELAHGPNARCVKDCCLCRPPSWDTITTVVIDPSPYASGMRAKWHPVALVHTMVTRFRRRVTREQLGRRVTQRDRLG